MKNETYTVKGNKTAADVVAGNEQVIGYCDTLEEARRAAIAAQKFEGFIAAWAEPGLTVPAAPEATMIAIDNHPKMAKAIERAKAARPRVTVISADARIYSVTGSKGGRYTVRFAVVGARKLAGCDCKAGQAGQLCYHVAGAAQVNVMTQSMRRRRATVPASQAAPRVVRSVERNRFGAKISVVRCDGWAV